MPSLTQRRARPLLAAVATMLAAASFAARPSHADFVPIVNFPKNGNAHREIQAGYPAGPFTTQNAFQTPFDIEGDVSGNNFAKVFGLNSALDIPVNALSGVKSVRTLISGYWPLPGHLLGTIEFFGSSGAHQSYPLVSGSDVRDIITGATVTATGYVIPPFYATTINGTTTQNVFTQFGVGNAGTGETGTYRMDEQKFDLDPTFANQQLVRIRLTNTGGDYDLYGAPILFGVTAETYDDPDNRRVTLHPNASYLYTNADDLAGYPWIQSDSFLSQWFPHGVPGAQPDRPIDLQALGFQPGESVTLVGQGAYSTGFWSLYGGTLGDDDPATWGLFSATDTLLPPSQLARVPDSLPAGGVVPAFTWGTYPDNQPTDVPNDFWIGAQPDGGTTVTVPAGARYLFTAPADTFVADEWDANGDYALLIRRTPTTTVTVDRPPDHNGWYTAPVQVTLGLTTPKNADLVAQILYGLDGTPSTPAASGVPVSVFGDGQHVFSYGSHYTNGAAEALHSLSLPIDTTAPTVIATANAQTLWPPNGKTVSVVVSGRITDALSGVAGATYTVVDSYGQVQPNGRASMGADGRFSISLPLEARRDGTDKNGRTYTATVTATDAAGNAGSATVVVTVPHDQGK